MTEPRHAEMRAALPMFPHPLLRNANALLRRARSVLALRLLPSRQPTSALCSLSGRASSACDSGSCDWFDQLLRSVIPHVRAERALLDAPPLPLLPESDLEGPPESPVKEYPVLSLQYPAAERVIAIGDLHGDMKAFQRALRSAGLLNGDGGWAGGSAVLVQVGDQLDRGDNERAIYDMLFRLQDEAPRFGGAVHILLGNHELMNIGMDFRYVTKGGFQDFGRNGGVKVPKNRVHRTRIAPPVMSNIRALPALMRARAKALSPGGPLAAELARRAQISVIIGDNVFVHGGLAPQHLTFGGQDPGRARRTLARLNEACREYLLGYSPKPALLRIPKSPIWLRDYSRSGIRPDGGECRMLAETLRMIKAKRMIVGHTPQKGINSACGGRVWRIDTGMSAAYGGTPEALEISRSGRIRIYSAKGVVQASARYK